MRFGIPCGCESRKEIMFTAGRMGLPEAGVLVLALFSIAVAYRFQKGN